MSIQLKHVAWQTWEFTIRGRVHIIKGGLDSCIQAAQQIYNKNASTSLSDGIHAPIERDPLSPEVTEAIHAACEKAETDARDWRDRTRATREQMETPINTPNTNAPRKPITIISAPKQKPLTPAKRNPYLEIRMTENGGRFID